MGAVASDCQLQQIEEALEGCARDSRGFGKLGSARGGEEKWEILPRSSEGESGMFVFYFSA